MTVQLFCEVKPPFSFHYKKLAETVANAVLDAEEFPYEAEVSLILTDNAAIREINLENRGIDSATDVLSFPMFTYPAPSEYHLLDSQLTGCVNPETDAVILGDMVLSVEKVLEQAAAFGHSAKREYAFLIVHSMLHLLGYDHMEENERLQMEERQRLILERLGILRTGE